MDAGLILTDKDKEAVRLYWEVRRYLESIVAEADLGRDEYTVDARDLLAMMTPETES